MPALLEQVKIVRHSNAVAAGSSTVTPSSGVDMAGFTNATFLVVLGAVDSGASPTIKLQQSDDDGAEDAYSDIEGSEWVAADDDDNGVIAVELIRFTKRYVKLILSRTPGNVTLNGILCLLSGSRSYPVTNTTLGNEVIPFPEEGSA